MEEERKNKNYLWYTIFGGWFGLHRYMRKQIGFGILYTLTFGLFTIGWFVDIIIAVRNGGQMPSGKEKEIPEQPHSTFRLAELMLQEGETQLYAGHAYTEHSKERIAGYTGSGCGTSIHIAKGVTYHTAGSKRKPIRETITTQTDGSLFVTNKRIVFIAESDYFEKKRSALSAIKTYSDAIFLQFGNKTYLLYTDDSAEIEEAIHQMK